MFKEDEADEWIKAGGVADDSSKGYDKMSIDLPDDLAIKIDIQFYSDTRDALLNAIVE